MENGDFEPKTSDFEVWPKVVAIVGPTAVGKSGLAMGLAQDFDAAIISADSRQVYRYMDIGTAKPSKMEQAKVLHYMLDLVEPDQQYSAQLFRQEGRRVLRGLAAEARPTLVVGGTGFYIRALLDGLSMPEVPPDLLLRRRLAEEAESLGSDVLHARLALVDPASADRIHVNNLPRVIRALEIVEGIGGPVPVTTIRSPIPSLYLGLRMDRRRLWEAADRRVHSQVQGGLIEETRRLLSMGYSPALPSLQGFAYRQMGCYLAGTMSLPDAIEGYKVAQHQFIRRQTTWFGKDRRITWLDAERDVRADARRMIRAWLDREDDKWTS